MPRFHLSFLHENRGQVQGDDAYHLLRVHRCRPGDSLEVLHGRTPYSAIVERCTRDSVEVVLLCELPNPEPPIAVELLAGLIKGDKFELVIQKAVELGVGQISPVDCSRSNAIKDRLVGKAERWERIAREAGKQSGRTTVPHVLAPQSFVSAIENCTAMLRIMAYEGGGESLSAVLASAPKMPSVAILVGPEGGFTDSEVELARRHSFKVVGLGPRILRAETASMALLAVVLYELGDIGG